jgi:hypothetical protein
MFMRRRRWRRAAVTGGGAHDDEQNERLATDPEFTAAKTKPLSG